MINQIFETLAANSSRNFKVDFLKQHKDNQLLKAVVLAALDPFTQYYIRKIPTYTSAPVAAIDLWEALSRLDYLSNRTFTGNEAIEVLRGMLTYLSADDAKVIERIIAKDLKCGVSSSTVNAVWPDLILEYPCMLASAYDQKLVDKVKYPAYAQLKMDGMRFNAIVIEDKVEFRSRNGKEILIADPNFTIPFIMLANGRNMVFDGELLVKDNGVILDRKTGNGILNKAVKGTQSKAEGEKVCATLWDMIPYAEFTHGRYDVDYRTRFNELADIIQGFKHRVRQYLVGRVDLVPSKMVLSLEEAQQTFEEYLADGQEGIILKTSDMIWENKRSKKQIKFKGEFECDLKVVGWVEGTGKNVGRMGALVLESADGVIKVGLGTGFDDADREAITEKDIGRIVAVKYNARIRDKRTGVESLFLPVFIEFRDDKNTADSSADIK